MIPGKVQRKASALVAAYISGEVHARTLTDSSVMVMNVGYRWRLMCLDPAKAKTPEGWQLLSHEQYNRGWKKR